MKDRDTSACCLLAHSHDADSTKCLQPAQLEANSSWLQPEPEALEHARVLVGLQRLAQRQGDHGRLASARLRLRDHIAPCSQPESATLCAQKVSSHVHTAETLAGCSCSAQLQCVACSRNGRRFDFATLLLQFLTHTLCDGQNCALLDGGRRGESESVHAAQQRVPQLHALERVDDLRQSTRCELRAAACSLPLAGTGTKLRVTQLRCPSLA